MNALTLFVYFSCCGNIFTLHLLTISYEYLPKNNVYIVSMCLLYLLVNQSG